MSCFVFGGLKFRVVGKGEDTKWFLKGDVGWVGLLGVVGLGVSCFVRRVGGIRVGFFVLVV